MWIAEKSPLKAKDPEVRKENNFFFYYTIYLTNYTQYVYKCRENYLFVCECDRCQKESDQQDVTSDEDLEEEDEEECEEEDEEKSDEDMDSWNTFNIHI